MTSNLERLENALILTRDPLASPEVQYEIIMAMADEVDAMGVSPHHSANMRHSALTMAFMFAGHGADEEWELFRKAMPWYKRIFAIKPDSFDATWSNLQRGIGRDMVARALRGEYDEANNTNTQGGNK